MITLSHIRDTIINTLKDPTNTVWSRKKYVIDAYEEMPEINQCDGAYPFQWADAMRERFGIKNLGDWCIAYGPEVFGVPLPCCNRALCLLEQLMAEEEPRLIYKGHYTGGIYYKFLDGEEYEWEKLVWQHNNNHIDTFETAKIYVRENMSERDVALADFDHKEGNCPQWSNL